MRSILRSLLAALAVSLPLFASAQLTSAERTTFKAALLAEADAELVGYRTNGQTGLIIAWYRGTATPAFTIWRWDVTSSQTGEAWSGVDIDGMSALNMQRLQLLLASSPSGVFDMTRSDRRAGFENPFGTNQNNASRVAMRAAWQRSATRLERLFVTGTGTAADPGTTSLRNALTDADVAFALAP